MGSTYGHPHDPDVFLGHCDELNAQKNTTKMNGVERLALSDTEKRG